MSSVSDKTSTSVHYEANEQLKQDNRPAFEQKYSPEELDAAYALLALSNSAPSPPSGYHGYRAEVIDPGVNLQTEDGGKRPNSSEVVHQVPHQPLNSQMPSPLAELNSFVAAALPVGDERYVYNQYTASQPRDFTVWRCENHGSWACQQCFHAVNP